MILYSNKKVKLKTNKLDSIVKKPRSTSELRNKIAHAKWYSLDGAGYVRCDIKTDRVSGAVKFKKYKITPAIIRRGMKTIENALDVIEDFIEGIWQ